MYGTHQFSVLDAALKSIKVSLSFFLQKWEETRLNPLYNFIVEAFRIVKFEMFSAVLLRIPPFWHVILCQRVIASRLFEGMDDP
jgi:hypothetical protein